VLVGFFILEALSLDTSDFFVELVYLLYKIAIFLK